jgi:hypothetical protein
MTLQQDSWADDKDLGCLLVAKFRYCASFPIDSDTAFYLTFYFTLMILLRSRLRLICSIRCCYWFGLLTVHGLKEKRKGRSKMKTVCALCWLSFSLSSLLPLAHLPLIFLVYMHASRLYYYYLIPLSLIYTAVGARRTWVVPVYLLMRRSFLAFLRFFQCFQCPRSVRVIYIQFADRCTIAILGGARPQVPFILPLWKSEYQALSIVFFWSYKS